MAVTVDTSTSVAATRGSRLTVVTSGGVDWVAVYSLADTRWEFWYSTTDGASWTENTSARITSVSGTNMCGAFALADNDQAFFAYTRGASVTPQLKMMSSAITSTSSWSETRSVGFSDTVWLDLCVAKRVSTSTYYTALVISHSTLSTLDRVYLYQVRYVSGSTTATAANTTIDSTAITDGGPCAIDWQHTGDGITPAATPPAVYMVYRDSDSTDFVRYTETTPGLYQTAGTIRTIEATAAASTDSLTAVFDGSRFVMAFVDDDGDTAVKWFERDAGDTTTTERTPTALSDGAITSLSLAVANSSEDARLYAVGTTSDDVKRLEYDRSAGTFDGSWTTIEATTATAETLSVQRGYQGDGHNVLWTSGSGSPYDIEFERDGYNSAPNAPTWVSPADNAAVDVTGDLTLDWAFSDPDDGDDQSAYALSRSVDGGAVSYWTGSVWGTETKIVTSTSSVTLSSWGSDGESHEYEVKTWDGSDEVGPYGSGLTVVASTPVTPVLTAPATSATVTVASPTVTWTATEQTAHQIRVLTSADVELYDSGKITSTVKSVELDYSLDDGLLDLKFELTTWNNEDLSASDTNTLIDIDYTPPATPVLTVTAVDASGYISVAIADPTPGGSEPTVEYHDLYVRVSAGGRQDGERTVNDDGIRISTGTIVEDGTYLDYAAASGVDYEYRTRAWGGGAATWSAWT